MKGVIELEPAQYSLCWSSSMKKVKVGIVGGGWFGNFHLDNLLTMQEVEVVAFASTHLNKLASTMSKIPNAHFYTSHTELMDSEKELDAIIVCVPPDSHDGVEQMAAQRNVHLYMEKPLEVSLERVNENASTIKNSNIITSVGYQTRYNPICDKIKKTIGTQQVGSVVANWYGIMPLTPWWRIKERSGGQLHEQVTHIIDLLRFFFGNVESVYSQGRKGLIRNVPHYDLEDTSTSIYTFESGLIASINCGCFVNRDKGKSTIGFSIFSDKSTIEYVWDTKASFMEKNQEQTYFFGNDFHKPALQTFIKAIQTKDSSNILSTYDDAVHTFKTTYATNLSLSKNEVIHIKNI